MGGVVERAEGNGSAREGAFGIVICHGEAEPGRPSAVAFVWGRSGRKERKRPSLPFGKWKEPADR